MKRGIYTMANDSALESVTALLNSIRYYDPDVPILIIPFDNNVESIREKLKKYSRVELFGDSYFLNRISKKILESFGKNFFDKPNKLRKQVCWFGPYDEFLYIDADIIVFEKIIDNLRYLSNNDFICCDYQYKRDIKDIFADAVIKKDVFTKTELNYVFNSGFWGSKKDAISEDRLYGMFAECASHPEYFDFSSKVSDQPIINYIILKLAKHKFNIVRDTGVKGPGSWAGTKYFKKQDHKLVDPNVNQPLKYIHWAGVKIRPGCPYYDIWKYYRDLK